MTGQRLSQFYVDKAQSELEAEQASELTKSTEDERLDQQKSIKEKLSGRYYVRKRDGEHGLGLEIEDTKQHNVRRLPKTLSSGESFIVSIGFSGNGT